MAKPILHKTSFGLIRTNPKLSSNVKVIVDSQDRIYLESIDANEELSNAKYKGFRVNAQSRYAYDLYNFYGKGKIPLELAFQIYESSDNLSVKSSYSLEYDFEYAYGAYPKPSLLYSEEYAVFAPLWLEPYNIPDYFIIFRVDDPVSISTKNATDENDQSIIELVENQDYFVDNILKKAKIISQFDLTERTNIGKYIRNHVYDTNFPEAPMSVKFEKNEMCYWNGIDIVNGGFVSKGSNIYDDLIVLDKTIIENDNFITNGFQRNGVVCANIWNMEFLFNDTTEDYRFSRYFGLYVSEAELGKFTLDGNALFDDRINENTQLPRPVENNIGYEDNLIDQIQTNENGIVIYPKKNNGSIFNGSLIQISDIIDVPKFGYIKDKNNRFYSIYNNGNWVNDEQLRIRDKEVNWKDFTGFTNPLYYVGATYASDFGRSMVVITVNGTPNPDDELRIMYVDPHQHPIGDGLIATNNHTIMADTLIPKGEASGLKYSVNGTYEEVAKAISTAINNIQDIFDPEFIIGAVNIGTDVIIYCRAVSENWNQTRFTAYTSLVDPPFNIIAEDGTWNNTTTYYKSPWGASGPAVSGKLVDTTFVGGRSYTKSRIVIDSEKSNLFTSNLYLKTSDGYSKISKVLPYIGEAIFNENHSKIIAFNNYTNKKFVDIIDDKKIISLNSTNQSTIFELFKVSNGFFSIYPIRDFDFDWFNTDYKKDADSLTTEYFNYLIGPSGPLGPTGATGAPGTTGYTGYSYISLVLGSTVDFIRNGGFYSLGGNINEIDGTIDTSILNEYDRLKENEVPELSVDSRVVPFINKWVYDNDGLDVRENTYRLDNSAAFGFSNFSPSFKEVAPNPKYFTHEWYYLQKYPPYMDFEERKNAFSYFDDIIQIGASGATGIMCVGPTFGDYFTDYFTNEFIGGTAINRTIKFSVFSKGNNEKFAETFFRGIKLLIKERVENSTPINYNVEELKYFKSTKFNDYKFSAILRFPDENDNSRFSIKVISNEKYKTVTFVITADLRDYLFSSNLMYDQYKNLTGPTAADKYYIDRSLLYTLKHAYDITVSTQKYKDVEISGAVEMWNGDFWNPYSMVYNSWYDATTTTWKVRGIQNSANGTYPNFLRDLTLNEDGRYNKLEVDLGLYSVIFDNIIEVQKSYFICTNVYPTLNPSISLTNYAIGDPTTAFVSAFTPIYKEGGYNSYQELIEDLSFASIADKVNNGDPTIEYKTIYEDGTIKENMFTIEFLEPEYFFKPVYLTTKVDDEKPTKLNTIAYIGSQVTSLERTYLYPMSRYSGDYTPRFRDVFKFIDFAEDINLGHEYFNTRLNIHDDDFGMITNLYYHKVNEENPKTILELDKSGGYNSLYPKIDEIAINKKDFYIFKSNWDINYYDKYMNKKDKVGILGTRNVLDSRSFFGSKIISTPDVIHIQDFTLTTMDIVGDLLLIDNFTGDVVVEYLRNKNLEEITELTGDIFKYSQIKLNVMTEKRLIDWLISNGFSYEFTKWINSNFNYGRVDILDDDVKEYIRQNIFQRYKIKEIGFYENIFGNNTHSLNPVELSFTDTEKLQKGYIKNRNFNYKVMNNSNLNFELIYNIKKGNNFSISMNLTLEKK